MKSKLLLTLLCIFIFACHTPKTHPPAVHKSDPVTKEYIRWDSVKLNGSISMVSSFTVALNRLGKPDSTIVPDYNDVSASYWNGKFKYYYFRGVQFEKYRDSIAFSSINFPKSPEWFLSYKNIKFNGKTTIDNFKKLFPISAEKKELHGTSIDKNQWIRIDTSPDQSDDAWIFLFNRDTGKLISVDHWIDD
jgi:hypothetical protein